MTARQGSKIIPNTSSPTLPPSSLKIDATPPVAALFAAALTTSVLVPALAEALAEALNDTNTLELRVYGNAARGQAVLVARLDNLGKGASGAAVQNIGLMLGVDVAARQKTPISETV